MLKRQLATNGATVVEVGFKDIEAKKLKNGTTEKAAIATVREKLDADIEVIRSFIHSKITDGLEANKIFTNIISEIAKVRYKDGFGSDSFIPWEEIYYVLQDTFEVNHDWPSEDEDLWHQATAEIAFLLNGKSMLYHDYSTEIFNQCADDVYDHLICIAGEIQ